MTPLEDRIRQALRGEGGYMPQGTVRLRAARCLVWLVPVPAPAVVAPLRREFWPFSPDTAAAVTRRPWPQLSMRQGRTGAQAQQVSHGVL